MFRDGHEVLGRAVRYRRAGERRWRESRMRARGQRPVGGLVRPERPGRWQYTVDGLGRPLRLVAEGGAAQGRGRAGGPRGRAARGRGPLRRRVADRRGGLAWQDADRALGAHALGARYEVDVDRVLARFGSWYELFPRSWGGFARRRARAAAARGARASTSSTCRRSIRSVGRTGRAGTTRSRPARAIRGARGRSAASEGGHTAVHPELGTIADFDRLVARARELGIEIALDFAIQCSPDHPWLREHPEWFHRRPDGTLKYAENPPKRYQDIYNAQLRLRRLARRSGRRCATSSRFWVEHGVRVFRVDNPHTKPVAVLGVADRRDPARATRRSSSSPRRSRGRR